MAAAGRLSSPLPIDAYLQLIDPLWSSGRLRGRIETIIPETHRAASLVIRPGRGWAGHTAGQWVGLAVDIDGVRHQRCYSLTSTPDRADGCITVTVQAIPGGLVSNHLVHQVEVGTVVHLDQAAGDFVLPPSAHRLPPLLFVTGGSGITPVMGMLRTLAAGPGIADAVVLHHAPVADDSIFAADLAALAERFAGLQVVTTFTGSGVPPAGAKITEARLDELCPDWRQRQAWACGPAPLLADAEAAWADAQLDDHLHLERFATARVEARPGAGGQIHFTASAATTMANGNTSILEAAEAAGLVPASGCRMGICHTCTVPLRSGSVCDLRDGTVHDTEGELVQICVSAAAGDVELDL